MLNSRRQIFKTEYEKDIKEVKMQLLFIDLQSFLISFPPMKGKRKSITVAVSTSTLSEMSGSSLMVFNVKYQSNPNPNQWDWQDLSHSNLHPKFIRTQILGKFSSMGVFAYCMSKTVFLTFKAFILMTNCGPTVCDRLSDRIEWVMKPHFNRSGWCLFTMNWHKLFLWCHQGMLRGGSMTIFSYCCNQGPVTGCWWFTCFTAFTDDFPLSSPHPPAFSCLMFQYSSVSFNSVS